MQRRPCLQPRGDSHHQTLPYRRHLPHNSHRRYPSSACTHTRKGLCGEVRAGIEDLLKLSVKNIDVDEREGHDEKENQPVATCPEVCEVRSICFSAQPAIDRTKGNDASYPQDDYNGALYSTDT